MSLTWSVGRVGFGTRNSWLDFVGNLGKTCLSSQDATLVPYWIAGINGRSRPVASEINVFTDIVRSY